MNESIAEIRGIIEEIEMTENLLVKLRNGEKGILLDGMIREMASKKRDLVKELISSLIQSPINKRSFKGLYQKAFEYLEKNDPKQENESDLDLAAFFKKAENLMRATG